MGPEQPASRVWVKNVGGTQELKKDNTKAFLGEKEHVLKICAGLTWLVGHWVKNGFPAHSCLC